MKRLPIAIVAFAAVCAVLLVLASTRSTPDEPEPEVDPVMALLQSCVDHAQGAERELDRENYGESRKHVAMLRDQLSDLVFLIAEKPPGNAALKRQ